MKKVIIIHGCPSSTEKAKLYLKMYDEKYTGRILKILKKKKG